MRLSCLILVTLFSVFSQSECILNGELVPSEDLGNYKYLVAILARAARRSPSEESLTEFCGGAILNERLILTAAHCFAKRSDGDIPRQELLKVIAHTRSNLDTSVTEGFILREVAKIYVHAGYFETRHDHDIAIIQLKKDLGLIRNFYKVKKVKLPDEDLSSKIEGAVLAGYGIYGFKEDGTPRRDGFLRTMKVEAFPDEVLGETLFRGKPTDLSQPKGFCGGDSGGPLVIPSSNWGITTDYTVIGLVKSNSANCDDREEGGVYTKVYYYLESFINKIIDDPENVADDRIRVSVISNVQACSSS